MTLFGDPATQLAFAVYENPGIFALLLGSGLSRAAEIPTGWEITTDLIRRIAVAQGVEDQSDWVAWYRNTEGKEPDYSELLGRLATTPSERRAILHRYIEPDEDDRQEGRKVPTAGHKAIARMVRERHFRVIVTTNFDRLLENALREEGIEPTIVGSLDALQGAEPITHSRCYILKLHGDYKDARILNTDDELAHYPQEYDALLDRIFDEHGLIVCGWSGEWDDALRSAILRAPNRRYPLFWASRGVLRGRGEDLANARKGIVVPITDADSFFTTLAEKVTTIAETSRQNPMGVDIVLSRAKKYLAGPEHRIQLADLIASELTTAMERLQQADMSDRGQATPQEIQRRVAVYEGVTEGLAKVAGLIGRWGNTAQLALVGEAIGALWRYANENQSGLVVFLRLRSYPAVLVFHAACLGLEAARNWTGLNELMNAPLETDRASKLRAVEGVSPLTWEGSSQDVWRMMPDMDRRYTPLADHFTDDIFKRWSPAFLPPRTNMQTASLIDEVLTAIAYIEQRADLAQLNSALNRDQQGRNFLWAPVGRSGWAAHEFTNRIQPLLDDNFAAKLAEAGFGHGSAEFVKAAITNHSRNREARNWW